MRSNLLTLIFIIGFSFSAFTQAALVALIFGDKVASEKFNISLEAGLGSSAFSNINEDFKRQSAFQFGIAANIKLNERWSLSPSAYFLSNRSVKLEDAPVFQGESVIIQPDLADAKITVSYIDVPLFVYYHFKNSKFRIGLAPQVSFRTSARAGYEFDTLEESYSATIKDHTEPMDIGIISNVSYSIAQGRAGKGVILSLRYYQGFNDVFRDSYQLIDSDNKANYIGFAVSFPFITDELAAKNVNKD